MKKSIISVLLSFCSLILSVLFLFGMFNDDFVELNARSDEMWEQYYELANIIMEKEKSQGIVHTNGLRDGQQKVKEQYPEFAQEWDKALQELREAKDTQSSRNFKFFGIFMLGFFVLFIVGAAFYKSNAQYSGTYTQSRGLGSQLGSQSAIETAADVVMGINAVKAGRDLINQKSPLQGEAKRVNRQRGTPPTYNHDKKKWE